MPQDTVWTDTHHTTFVLVPEGTDEAVKQYIQEHPDGTETKKQNNKFSDWAPFIYTIGILALIWIIIRIRDGKDNGYVALGSMVKNESDYDIPEGNEGGENAVVEEPDYLVYEGSELNLGNEELLKILNKRSEYFVSLNETDKDKFLYRLQKFIKQKTFFIHDKSGFKEMPVLISAAAIQLSFGLQKFLLPDFPNIHIFPEEFFASEPTLRFLEGNVSGNSINISWKHFLNGFNNPTDGQNVGLHEMAHAYYYQNIETPDDIDHNFVHTFSRFDKYGNKCFENEQQPGNDLYSDYALKNFQEFWAESVEIFFEKPIVMKEIYPDLYLAISDLLNQDPASKLIT